MTDHPELVIHGGVLQLTPTPTPVWLPHRPIPLTGRSLTPRPRLITQLESAIQTSRIVVVCGEAGAGKTSLVACWASQVGSGTGVDWRALDGSGLVELLGQPLIEEPGLVDTSLRSPQDRRVVVVVDDFPVEPDRAACAALELFLERAGPQVGVVLISLGSPRLDTQRLGLGADRLAIDS